MNNIERMKVELSELQERVDNLEEYANKDALMNLHLVKIIEILEECLRQAKGENK